MLQGWVIVLVSFAYLCLLFAIAFYGDRRADQGRSLIASPYVYALSLTVYATAWTFYGSVGRAAADGMGFLPIYLGPTLMAILWWICLRKIIRISKVHRITSLADFVGSRYGKSGLIAGLVTVIAVVGILPYISLQLKAISNSFAILAQYPSIAMPEQPGSASIPQDTAFYVAIILAGFTIAFGTRELDAAERHEGMVAAIAFESIVKLVAFLAVGFYVTFGIFDGFADIFTRARAEEQIRPLLTPFTGFGSYANWAWLTFLSLLAVMFLPRQFQVAVVENVDERHLRTAVWLFPLYMLAINVFVLPIAFGGLLRFPGGVDADTYVLTLPMSMQHTELALLAFIGGLSAATGMVIVETIALATMVCNDLVMPVLLRSRRLRLHERTDLRALLLDIRRWAIVIIIMLGYFYFRLAGEAYALVSIGLISFAAVAQFAPAVLGGIYWRGATRAGALAGLCGGTAIWAYTLLLPALAKSGWLPDQFMTAGPFGIALLKPLELFGLTGLDQITHAMIWSMLVNVGLYVGVSLVSRPSAIEHRQAILFVDVFRRQRGASFHWRGTASAAGLQHLVGRFLGPERAQEEFERFAREHRQVALDELRGEPELAHFAERLLAGAVGASSARVLVATLVEEAPLALEDVMHILDETSQAIAYSHQLEKQSKELEDATRELRAANERLTELDRMKDEFLSTVSHELRTPLTSIRALGEILHDNPDLDRAERVRFLGIVIKESERLTRLINQVLDLARLEAGKGEWHDVAIDVPQVVEEAVAATGRLFEDKRIAVTIHTDPGVPRVRGDRDRLIQVMLNLLSNAVKFSPEATGRVRIAVYAEGQDVRVDVADNGIGIHPMHHESVFEKFRQVGDTMTDKPAGSGLGLTICRQIVGHFGGRLWVESAEGAGATFSFTLPLQPATPLSGAAVASGAQ
jgi:Na+/proline symporter/nitrogen-specific signal transduction histidine kinase